LAKKLSTLTYSMEPPSNWNDCVAARRVVAEDAHRGRVATAPERSGKRASADEYSMVAWVST